MLVDTHGGAPISALPPPKKSYFRLLPIHDKRFKCNIMVKAFPGKIERVPLEPHMLFWAVFRGRRKEHPGSPFAQDVYLEKSLGVGSKLRARWKSNRDEESGYRLPKAFLHGSQT